MSVDFNRIISVLNQARLQTKDPALYRALANLISSTTEFQAQAIADNTAIRTEIQAQLTRGTAAERLKYKPQSIVGNIVLFFETDTGYLWIFNPTTNTWVEIGAPIDATYLTWTDEHAVLPNSRQLVAGTNVTFDDTVVHERIVNVATTQLYMPMNVGDLFMTIGDGDPMVIPWMP